ncbi:hypothetical protein GBAR_LOCUS4053, partial [Geodia barretti]
HTHRPRGCASCAHARILEHAERVRGGMGLDFRIDRPTYACVCVCVSLVPASVLVLQ